MIAQMSVRIILALFIIILILIKFLIVYFDKNYIYFLIFKYLILKIFNKINICTLIFVLYRFIINNFKYKLIIDPIVKWLRHNIFTVIYSGSIPDWVINLLTKGFMLFVHELKGI